MEVGGFEGLEVTEAGLREGVFFEHHLGGEPPLFDDVRRASVVNLAAQYDMDPEHSPHTAHVAHLALGLFDELAAAGLHDGDPVERELLWAAALLHDIGMTVDYDDHHKHSRYLVLNAGLPGFEQRELALIGQAVRYHRKGMPVAGPVRPAGDQGRRGAPEPHVHAACGWPRTSSARATSSCARPTSPSTTARCASSSSPTATTASRAGPPGARSSSSRAPSTVS